jgi:hypothetical protein
MGDYGFEHFGFLQFQETSAGMNLKPGNAQCEGKGFMCCLINCAQVIAALFWAQFVGVPEPDLIFRFQVRWRTFHKSMSGDFNRGDASGVGLGDPARTTRALLAGK